MLGILAKSFRTATRNEGATQGRRYHQIRPHWPLAERRDLRSSAELEAHLIARRRY